ncbi:MAG: lytic transglycosylase domain-containing protein [Woeseiaceae bacterium]|nr:lytic transglycosylase domain-containing protein [Woeseiaceae bacterium]
MKRAIRQGAACTILLATFLIASGVIAASNVDPDAAWRNYLRNDTGLRPGYRFPHASCFRAAAARYGLPETLLLAVARGESDFEPTARSKANAHGVMQILWPTTANHLGIYRLTELYDPCTNIDAGARYLKEMLARFDGNLHLALAAYNYGPERIEANRDAIPSGARWYSGYILRHLNYVLGNRANRRPNIEHLYSELGRSTLVSFGEPYRAAAFVERLEASAPGLQLDWFRKDVGKFSVVLTYADREQFKHSARLLEQAGFRLD